MLSILGVVAFGVYFFQLKDVQTRIVKSLTQQLSTTYKTDLSIRSASIDLLGNLKLYDFLVLDHQKDTLFYGQEITTELESLENFINRDYSLSTLSITGPYLKEKRYLGEQESNLQQFFKKIENARPTPKKEFTLSLDVLKVNGGRYKRINVDQSEDFTLVAEFQKIRYQKNSLQFALKQLSGSLPYLGKVSELSANFEKNRDSLNVSSLQLLSDKLKAIGEAALYLPMKEGKPDFEAVSVDFYFDLLETRASNVSSQANTLPIKDLRVQEVSLTGPLEELQGTATLYLGEKIKVTTGFSGDFKSKEEYRFESKDFEFTWAKNGLYTLLSEAQQKELPMVLPQKGALSAAVEMAPNEFSLAFDMLSDLGTIVGDVNATKKTADKTWEGTSRLDWKNVQWVVPSSAVNIRDINASFDLSFKKEEAHPLEIQWDAEVKNMQWNARNLYALSSSGVKIGEKTDGNLSINDPTFEGNITWQYNPIGTSEVNGEIKAVNLSEWTIASTDKVAVLSTKFISNFEKNKGTLQFNGLVVDHQNKKTMFTPIRFSYEALGENKTVVSNSNNALEFSLTGLFEVNTFPSVVRSAFEEVVFFRPHKVQAKKSAFSFSLLLKQPLIKALYPEISTSNDLQSEGYITSVKGDSYFKMELPLLKVGNYAIEGLRLETSNNNPFFNTYLTASALQSEEFSVRNVNLLSFTADQELLVRLEGEYGKYNDAFELNFNHQYQNNLSQFLLKNAKISSPQGAWRFNNEKEGSIVYDFLQKRVAVKDVYAENGKQEIAIDGFFKNKSAFEIDFIANAVRVEDLLPPSEKFSLAGEFSAKGTLGLNDLNPSNALQIQLKSMTINDRPMGDFRLGVESNSSLNTFRLDGDLIQDQNTSLFLRGSAFIKEEALNVDVDFDLNQFGISFLSRLGKDKMTKLKGALTGKLNLWGGTSDLHLDGNAKMDDGTFYLPATNVAYALEEKSSIQFSNATIRMNDILLSEETEKTKGVLNMELQHTNFKGWTVNLDLTSDRFLVYNKNEDPEELFYGKGFLNGIARLDGPTKALTLSVDGTTAAGTTLTIPWDEDKGLSDTNFIDFLSKKTFYSNPVTAKISDVDEDFRGFEMNFDLDVNQNAEIEIVVDQSSGSTLSGRGAGNILIESNIDGKFNIWGDFITTSGIYNFKNLGLIDKKFKVLQGGTIVWEGDPIEAQMNLEAVYEVPGGANPALLVDNPNFNKKIPTDVKIQLQGNLLKPDDPLFEIEFPNASTVVKSEINYRLADQQRRQLQAISLLSQGVFISDVSLSVQGIANNLYEKASDVFSTLLGSSSGKLDVGVNYLKGDETPFLDARTEDRIGVTLTTQISDKILINGKIGVPVGGVEETLIVGDVQIDFILNEDGTLKAKVFNKENEFRYLGDEIGYTQGVGLSYQVDFDNFRALIQKITKASKASDAIDEEQNSAGVEFLNKKY